MRARRYKQEYRGQVIDLFTIGVLAKAIGRTPQAVLKQVMAGFVPETPFLKRRRDNAPLRLYTKGMIEAVRDVVTEIGMRSIRTDKRDKMHAAIVEKWRGQGIEVGTPIDVVDPGTEADDPWQAAV